MTDFLTYKNNKAKLNKDKTAKDMQLLDQLNSKDMQMDLKIKNSTQTGSEAYIAAAIERKDAMDRLKKDVRNAYGDEIANEAEVASKTFTPDIF